LDTDVNMLSCFWLVVKTVERGKKKKQFREEGDGDRLTVNGIFRQQCIASFFFFKLLFKVL
jgi:hypothetical protein